MTRREKILKILRSGSLSPAELAERLALPEKSRERFEALLSEMLAEGDIVSVKKGRLLPYEDAGRVRGTVRVSPKGFGFVIREDGGEDVHIRADMLGTAVNGDTVLAKLLPETNGKREGAVELIIRRAVTKAVGVLNVYKGMGVVTPDDERLPREIFIPASGLKGENGQKVVARITEYMNNGLRGEVEEILGYPNDFGVDVLSIIKSYDFDTEFPKKVLAEAEAAPAEISAEALRGRLDLRGEKIITIDGDDSKDLDDAVSLKKTEKGWRLGVHIADVSHYVRPGSALDKEALRRGTSVYLVDRVIPMLPPRLSNGLCSLNQGEDRLTLSVFVDMDARGNVLGSSFHKSVICSARRMTYNNVWRLIRGDADLEAEYADILPMLRDMYALSLELKKRAAERGYVELNIPEAKAVLDEDGRAVDIELREMTGANELIEQFMVCANMAVAAYLWKNRVPAVYRVHADPSDEKMQALRKFAASLGCNPNAGFRALVREFVGRPEERAVSMMALRSMAKAAYSPTNSGHYGLAAADYCHFTSPIRRYPDLICHRALKAAIDGDAAAQRRIARTNAADAEACSEREMAAERCERDTLDLKKAEYMEPFVGQDFVGIISSVTGFGFFVMLPNTVEGLVPVTSLSDDYYVFDEETLTLRGERRHKEFRLGDQVEVTLVSANKQSRKLEFVLKGDVKGGGKKEGKEKNRAAQPKSKKEGARHGGKRNKNSRPKQKRVSRVFHRRKNRGRN